MKKLVLPIAVVAMAAGSLYAQDRTVTGRVVDEFGEGVPGASITVKGSQIGTVTDEDGNFSLNVPGSSRILVVSSVGFGTQEVEAGNGSEPLAISFNPNTTMLNETVVTALGIKRSEKSLGYAAQQLKADAFENSRDGNVINSLAGKVAGVRVNTQSGAVGGTSKIVIRGSSSLSGSSQPLFVVDGVPISNASQGVANTGIGVDFGNRAADINPDDIETMTVLKGPAATAQYGSLAKDGAIIITTKRGSKNGDLSISLNSSYRIDQALILPDLQDQYAQGRYGQYSLRYANGWGPKISDMQGTTVKDFLGRDVTLKANPDNLSNFFRNGNTFINDIALSGGDAKNDYRVSFGALNSNGIVEGQRLDRYNLGANVGHAFNDKLSSRFTFNYSNTKAKGRPVQSSNNSNVLASSIYSVPITVDMNDLRNHYTDSMNNQIYMTTDKDGNNPFWIINKNINSNTVDRFFGSQYLEYKPISWLTISNNFGFDMYNEGRMQVVRHSTAGRLKGGYNDADIIGRRINNDLMATYQDDLNEDVNLKVMLGHNILDRKSTVTGVDAVDLQIDGLYRPNNAATATPYRSFSQSRLVALYGEISASYRDFLYLTITGRNDWSSTLPIANRSYFYPSVTGTFVFSEVMKPNNILNFGKLRMSYAEVGSDTDPYQLTTTYAAASSYFVQYITGGNLFPHLGVPGFTGPRIMPNENLKPQRAQSFEVGTDLRFWNNRVGLDLTYYNTKTKDQILAIDIPLSTGFFAKMINAGQITNKGLEAILRVNPVRTNDFSWDFMANFARNVQTVDALEGELKAYTVQSGWSGLQIKAPVGQGFGLYGTTWKRSPNGDFVINANTGLREVVNNQFIGKVNPDFMLGLSNRFSFKGVNLGFLVDIRQGGVFYSGTVAGLRSSGMARETMENREGAFIDKGVNEVKNPDGTITYVPNETPVQSMQDFWGHYSSTTNTEGNVFDASFVKLREVTLSYAFPHNFKPFKNVVKGLEIGFEARNLWLIKSYVPHVDPELNYFGANSAGDGVEFNSFPSTKSYGINLKVKF